MKIQLTALTAAILAGCAQSPDAIAPIALGNAYAASPCSSARAMLATETATLTSLSAEQRNAVTGDAIGVALTGIPLSSLTGGDREGKIATSKGKILSLEQRLRKC